MPSKSPSLPSPGFLEVGTNDKFEVVINHPDLKPDANGVGHIVFSQDEAIALARLLTSKARYARKQSRIAHAEARIIREGVEDGTRCEFCKELNGNCDCEDAPDGRPTDEDYDED